MRHCGALALVMVAVSACGGSDEPDANSGAGGQGASGQGGDGGGSGGAASACSAPEGVTAIVTLLPVDQNADDCTVASVAAGPPLEIGLSCMGATPAMTLELDAEPAIASPVVMGDAVVLTVQTQNLEGPEIWGALRASDGSLLLGWVSAGSLASFRPGDPWYAPLTIEPGDCSEEDARTFWTVGFGGDEAVVADGQRRAVGPADEYVVQAAGLRHPEGMVASTPTNTHVAVIARQ